MSGMSIEAAARACGGRLYAGNGEGGIEGAAIDSRKVKHGDLFVAIKGENTDGHKYIGGAVAAGASCVLIDDEDYFADAGVPVILAEDSVKALQEIARAYRASLDLTVIGVTGSVGKTSTAEMIKAVCDSGYRTVKTPGNYNNHLGLPLSIMSIAEDTEVAVLEMGMSDLGEIELLASIALPDIAVITNIGISHIENLGSRDNIFRAKMEITSFFGENNTLIVDGEDDYLKNVRSDVYKVIKVGGDYSIRYKDIVDKGEKGIEFTFINGDDAVRVALNVIGAHNVKNAALALACGVVLGIDPGEAKISLGEVLPAGSRLKVIDAGNMKIIDDTYNASPASMMAAVDALMNMEGERKIAILGDMFELGDASKEAHRGVGEYALAKGVDLIICIGEHAWDIYKGTGRRGIYFHTKEDLYEAAGQIMMPGDTILVKGSNGMHMEKIVARLTDGDY